MPDAQQYEFDVETNILGHELYFQGCVIYVYFCYIIFHGKVFIILFSVIILRKLEPAKNNHYVWYFNLVFVISFCGAIFALTYLLYFRYIMLSMIYVSGKAYLFK